MVDEKIISWNMKVREATTSDAKQIEKLYKELVNSSEVNVCVERIEQVKLDDNNFLFVIGVDGVIECTCFLTICLDPMYGHQPYGVVENIIVSSEYRHSGLGSALFQHIESLCLKKGCSKIMIQSSKERKSAHGFFEATGFDQQKKTGFVNYRRNIINVFRLCRYAFIT